VTNEGGKRTAKRYKRIFIKGKKSKEKEFIYKYFMNKRSRKTI